MAVLGKFDDASVTYNSVDLSAFVRSVTVETTRSEEDISAMGDSWSEFTIGRGEWTISVDFWQSFYTAEVDATLWPQMNAPGTGQTMEVIPVLTGGVGTTNPSFTGTCLPTSYTPLDGNFDENLSTTITFRGTGALTRATS